MVRAEHLAVLAIRVFGRSPRAVESKFGSISTLGLPRLPVRTV
jgi:hypothetical protein